MTKNIEDLVSPWMADFIKRDVTDTELEELINAANFLMIDCLIDLASAELATRIRGLSFAEFRQRFPNRHLFSPEQEADFFNDS